MNSSAIREDWVGRDVDGRFPLLQWLGGTEESGVFLTELPGDGAQKAAIKLIPADGENAENRMEGWAATSTLKHAHLMPLIQTGRCTIDSVPLVYAVTEYAEENLSQVLPERPLTPAETREMLAPVLDALAYLHGKGVVHGALKPSNILVAGDQVKLSGDRLLAAGRPRNSLTTLSVHDAPERETGAVSEAADIWSLGVTLVEALTQHPPVWDRAKPNDRIVPNSIPQPFLSIARECLRSDSARRCSLAGIRARLSPALPSATAPVIEPVATAPAAPEPPVAESPGEIESATPRKSRKMILAAAAFVVIAVIEVVVLLEVRSHKTVPSTPSEVQRAAVQRAAATDAAPSQAPTAAPAPATATSRGAAVKGEVAERVMPDVLPSARASIQGQVNVRIRVDVDASGKVSNATFEAASPSRYFARVAMQAAQQWRFKPAQVDGRAVPSVWTLKFQFKRAGTEVAAAESSP